MRRARARDARQPARLTIPPSAQADGSTVDLEEVLEILARVANESYVVERAEKAKAAAAARAAGGGAFHVPPIEKAPEPATFAAYLNEYIASKILPRFDTLLASQGRCA